MTTTVPAAPSGPTLSTSRVLLHGALPGVVAGILGGIAFGASMIELGQLASIASLVRADSAAVGAMVHLAVSAVVGAVFGMLMFNQRATAGDTLVWGMAYGAFFWIVGPLTLRPLILGQTVTWDIRTAQEFSGSLIGHVVWGAVAGLSFAALRTVVAPWRAADGSDIGTGSRRGIRGRLMMASVGMLAGLASAGLLTLLLPNRNELTAPVAGTSSGGWLGVIAIGVVAGALYAVLEPYSTSPRAPRLGARLVQGMALGYLAWIVVALTIVPLADIDTLAWKATLVRDRFEVFPGYLLFGVLLVVLFCVISGGGRFLFTDQLRQYDRLTAGPQRLRAATRGAFAGIVGGLLFTIIMVKVGALGRVSKLVGAHSSVVGFFVHMVIAVFIGGTYALLFRRHSFDVRSAVGWGLSYGFLWWILGALTLLPVLLGGSPEWSAAEAGRVFPSLVGHLAYGVGLGVVFYLLEARYSPWWITRSDTESDRARARREQVFTSAPALWAFSVFLSLFVVIVLARVGP